MGALGGIREILSRGGTSEAGAAAPSHAGYQTPARPAVARIADARGPDTKLGDGER
jgi:hypothetical protein